MCGIIPVVNSKYQYMVDVSRLALIFRICESTINYQFRNAKYRSESLNAEQAKMLCRYGENAKHWTLRVHPCVDTNRQITIPRPIIQSKVTQKTSETDAEPLIFNSNEAMEQYMREKGWIDDDIKGMFY